MASGETRTAHRLTCVCEEGPVNRVAGCSPFAFLGFLSSPRSLPAAARPVCWMPFLARLFAATSQTSRLLRSLPPSPPRPCLSRLARPLPRRSLYTSMPALASHAPKPLETHGNFDLIKRFKLDFADIYVSKWKSRASGLSVVHLDYEGAPPPSLSFHFLNFDPQHPS